MKGPFPSLGWWACFEARRADWMVRKVLRTLPFLTVDAVSLVYAHGELPSQMPLVQALKRARLGALQSARREARIGSDVRPVWVVLAPFSRISVWAGHEPAQTWTEITPDLKGLR